MVDVLTEKQRRLNMSRIKGRDTRPEMVFRKGLHSRGYRYRLHSRALPGRPDLVLPRYRVAAFVHGCFWHGHSCHLFRWPATRAGFWEKKILGNAERDKQNLLLLKNLGWRVLIVWECAMKGRHKLPVEDLLDQAEQFIKSGKADLLELSAVCD